MRLLFSLLVLSHVCEAFQGPVGHRAPPNTALFMAKKRQSKRNREVERSRPKSFYDKLEQASGDGVATKVKKPKSSKEAIQKSKEEIEREERAQAAQERMEKRPPVSTMIVDEEGTEIVAQGQNVLDVISRKAVQLSPLGPNYRLAQLFPGVPPDVRQKYRWNWQTAEVPDMVESFRQACLVDGQIPPHPSVANKAIDFVLANRDRMSARMKQCLGRLTLREASQGSMEQAKENKRLWKHFLTLENHISAPFRQMMMDAEGRVGPNFGNLDLKSFADGHVYERATNYLVLKGMVAHWEKKVVDADTNEKTEWNKENYMQSIALGDPRRFLENSPVLFTLKECTQVCYMAQQMTQAFAQDPELFDDLPPEIRFVEAALSVQGGAALRKFVVDEFCPAEGLDPESLREGVRRLYCQLENMQIDPYADLTNMIENLVLAMSVGTDDERDPYIPYLVGNDGPGSFQTYTFNYDKLSLVRFFDTQYVIEGDAKTDSKSSGGGLADLFNFDKKPPPAPKKDNDYGEDGEYKTPDVRAMDRPHDLGWWEALNENSNDKSMKFGQVPAGKIIPDE